MALPSATQASNHLTGPSSNADARDIMLKVIGKCPCCATLGAVTLHILGDVCNQDNQDALQWLLRLGSCATDPSVEASGGRDAATVHWPSKGCFDFRVQLGSPHWLRHHQASAAFQPFIFVFNVVGKFVDKLCKLSGHWVVSMMDAPWKLAFYLEDLRCHLLAAESF